MRYRDKSRTHHGTSIGDQDPQQHINRIILCNRYTASIVDTAPTQPPRKKNRHRKQTPYANLDQLWQLQHPNSIKRSSKPWSNKPILSTQKQLQKENHMNTKHATWYHYHNFIITLDKNPGNTGSSNHSRFQPKFAQQVTSYTEKTIWQHQTSDKWYKTQRLPIV